MQSNIFTLLRADFLKQSGINILRYERDSKKKNRAVGMAVIYIFVGIIMVVYSFAFSFGMGSVGMSDVIPGYSLTITALITLFFSFFKTNGVMFASHDYNMLISLPIRIETVITAKFLSMYLSNLLFAIMIMVPMEIGYALWNHVTVGVAAMWAIAVIIAPLLPMTIAAIIGTCIAAVGSGFRHKVLVQVLLSVTLIVVIFGASFWFQTEATQDKDAFLSMVKDMGKNISSGLHKVYPLSAWFDCAIVENSFLSFLFFTFTSGVIYFIFVFVCGKYYRRINTALMSHHSTANYKMGELKVSSLMSALIKKEAKRFFSSVVYLINVGIGIIFALMISVAMIFIGADKIFNMMGVVHTGEVLSAITFTVPFIIALVVNMSCTTPVSLSLEGKNLWIVQSLPIDRATLLKSKMLFNLLLVLPASLICSVVFMFELKVTVVQAILYLFVSVASVMLTTVWGMWINLHFPNYAWENEVEVIKQGMANAIAIFSGMIIYSIMSVLAFFLSTVIAGELVMLMLAIMLVLLAAIIYRSVIK